MDQLAASIVPALSHIEPYTFHVPVDKADGLGSEYRRQSMALPHETLAFLYAEYPTHFHRVFGTDKLVEWWGRQDAGRLERHPQFDQNRVGKTIPVRLYGDDVAVAKTVHCLVLLWTSLAVLRLPALEALVSVSSTRLERTDGRSIEEVYRVLRWSLEVLGTGKWPATDHNGEPWPEGSTRAERAEEGEDLAEGWVALSWEIVGDWKWLAEAVGFKTQKRYYNCTDICHKCSASINGLFLFVANSAVYLCEQSVAT